MEKKIEILIVDDHQVVRDGLQGMLEQEPDFEVVGQSGTADSTLENIRELKPDIVLMDIKMPGVDGIELTRRVMAEDSSCNVVMLTLYDEYLQQALEAGAKGYILKDVKSVELSNAIRKVYSGQVVVSDSLAAAAAFNQEENNNVALDENFGDMVEELQLVLSPPVEANQLMRFAGNTEKSLQSRVMQMVGDWQEGTVMTVVLQSRTELNEVINTLREIPGIMKIGEIPTDESASTRLLKKVEAMPGVKNRARGTIFITMGEN